MNQDAKIRRLVAMIAALFLVSCGDSNNECALPAERISIPDAVLSTLSANPTSEVPADGKTKSTITVTARDGANNPLSAYNVSINVSGTNNVVSPSSELTNSNGVATWTLASTTAETKFVTASILYDPPCPCGAACLASMGQVTLSQTASIEFVNP